MITDDESALGLENPMNLIEHPYWVFYQMEGIAADHQVKGIIFEGNVLSVTLFKGNFQRRLTFLKIARARALDGAHHRLKITSARLVF